MAWVCAWCSKSNWNTCATCYGCKLTPEQARAECASCIPLEPIGKAPGPKAPGSWLTNCPTVQQLSKAHGKGLKGRRTQPRPLSNLTRSYGSSVWQQRPPDPIQVPRLLNDSAHGWVDRSGRPDPRVAPAAIGSLPIAGTLNGIVHSI